MKEKLIYISSSTFPSTRANSVHVMKMCSAFAEHFDKVMLFARGSSEKKEQIFNYYGVKQNFALNLIKPRKLPGLRAFHYITTIIREINSYKTPFVLYTRYLYLLPFLLIFYKVYYEAHDLPIHGLRRFFYKLSTRSRNLLGVIYISEKLRQLSMDKYPSLKLKASLIAHDGANIYSQSNDVNINAIIDIVNDKAKIGYVGSLYPGRGIDVILNVASQMHHCDFFIVGGSDIEISHWMKQLISKNVLFLGHIEHSAVHKIMQAFDLLLAPYQDKVFLGKGSSSTADYMSPLKIFEYMAAKRPIIVSDLSVIREIFPTEQTAMLVKPDDTEQWVEAIAYLLENPEKAKAMALNAHKRLQNHYTWEARAERITNFVLGSNER